MTSEATARVPAEPGGEPEAPALPDARALLARYEREARARGATAAAAPLWYEMGRLWEARLGSLKEAAACYQKAYLLDTAHRPTLAAARRLFTRAGNWPMAIQLCEAELSVGPSPPEARVLRLAKARLLGRLGKLSDAAALLGALWREDPSDPVAAGAFEAASRASGDLEAVAAIAAGRAEAAPDPRSRASALGEAAALCEGPLGRPDEAADLWRRARESAPEDAAALAGVRAHAARQERWEERIDALRAEAAAAIGGEAAALCLLAARTAAEHDREPEALGLLKEAREQAPGDPAILDELIRFYDERELFPEQADALRARAALSRPAAEAADLWARLGALYGENGRDEEAIAAWQEVLARAPGRPDALAALGKLHHRRSDWTELLAIYEAELTAANDPERRADRLFRSAELLETRLSRPDEAAARYAMALENRPGDLPALRALARLHERAGRWEELCALLDGEVETAREPGRRTALRTQIARIAEERLHDVDRAIAVYEAILTEPPEAVSTLRSLARLCERAERWDALVAVRAREAALAGDQKQILDLLHENAETVEQRIGDPEKAIAAWREVLSLAPTYVPALEALGRLYEKVGRWEEQAAMARDQAEVAKTPEARADLLCRAAALLHAKGREGEAIAAWREALAARPGHLPVLRALARAHRRREEWEELVGTLRAEAEACAAPDQKAAVLVELGEAAARHGHEDLAEEAWRQARALVPGHPVAALALCGFYESRGRLADLCALEEALLAEGGGGPPTAPRRLALGRRYEQVSDLSRAAKCFEIVLASGAEGPAARAALEGLLRVHAARKNPLGRAEVREKLAGRTEHGPLAAALFLLAGEDREEAWAAPAAGGGGREEQAAATMDYRWAVELDPESRLAREALDLALRRAGDRRGLVELWADRLDETPGEGRAVLALDLAEIVAEEGEDERALALARRGLASDPVCVPLLELAASLARRRGDLPAAREAFERLAAVFQEPSLAVEALREAAGLARQIGGAEGGEADLWRKLLELDPLDAEATARLAEMLEAAGDGAGVLTLRERRAIALAAAGDPEAADALFGLARQLFAEVKDPGRALRLLDRALAAREDHPGALLLRADLLATTGREKEAVEGYRLAVEHAPEPRGRAEASFKLGALLQDRLADPARAKVHLQDAAGAGPGPEYAPALERLARLHEEAGDFRAAAAALDRLSEAAADPEAAAAALLSEARVLLDGAGDDGEALAVCRRAHGLAPEDPRSLSQLCAIEQRLGDWPAAAVTLEKLAVAKAAADPGTARTLLARAAEIHVQELHRPAGAISVYRRALTTDPGNLEWRAALADLYGAEPGRFREATAEHLALIEHDAARVASYRGLQKVLSAGRVTDRAYCAAAVWMFLDPGDAEARALHAETRSRLPAGPPSPIADEVIERRLRAPAGRGLLSAVLRLLAECVAEVAPWPADRFRLRRRDRLDADHPVRRLCDALGKALAIGEVTVYAGEGTELSVLPGDPAALVVGADIVRRYSGREQRFLLGRLVARAREGSAIAAFVDAAWLVDFVGAALRLAAPGANVCGRPDEALTRRIGKALSRSARRRLEGLVSGAELAPAPEGGLPWARSLATTADRAGLLLAGDVGAALTAAAAVDAGATGSRATKEQRAALVRENPALAELLRFSVSDDLEELRVAANVAVRDSGA